MNRKQSKYAIQMYTIDGKPYLTKKGRQMYNRLDTRWNIVTTWCQMHQYQSKGQYIYPGDYFSGPRFYGDGLKQNLFTLSMDKNDECQFQQIKCNETNMQKINTDIKLNDFTWFKSCSGEYYFACWNEKRIAKLSIYWTKEGIDALITKRDTYEKMVKEGYHYSRIHALCRVPHSKLYWE